MSLKDMIRSILNEEQLGRVRALKHLSPTEIAKDISADVRLLRAKSVGPGTIRVGFIVQMAEIWDKESPIYDAMTKDDKFKPEIIIVPPYDLTNKTVTTSYEDNYFLKNYPDAIKAYDGGWIDLKPKEYDYVFLQRPYDSYLPKGFKSSDLSRFTKVCYIPYGFSGADMFNGGNTNKGFFRNVYFSFLETDYMVGMLKKKFKLPLERKAHKIVNLGYPALIPYFSIPERKEVKELMWTPRWTFTPSMGMSNFLKYKDDLIELAEEHKEQHFTFRPHPLMIEELRAKGLMTDREILDYLDRCKEAGISYDKGRPIFETFSDTDILITDYSSIIIQFYITGRPIILCDSGIEFNELYKKLAEGIYLAKNAEDLNSYVSLLTSGEDPLYGIRQKVIREELELHKNSTEAIVCAIKDDARKR